MPACFGIYISNAKRTDIMDWFPLYNSIRIALISTVIIFFVGIFSAYYIAKAPRLVKGVLDVFLTLPLVLPPDRKSVV